MVIAAIGRNAGAAELLPAGKIGTLFPGSSSFSINTASGWVKMVQTGCKRQLAEYSYLHLSKDKVH